MNKETILKILRNERITMNDLNSFITDYVKLMQNKDITLEQLQGITHLVQSGIFNIRYAAKIAGIKSGLNITELLSKEGVLLNVMVSEA